MDTMNKTVEEHFSLAGSAISDLSTGESVLEQNSVVLPSSMMDKLKNEGERNLITNIVLLQNRARKIVLKKYAMDTWKMQNLLMLRTN